MTRIGVVGKHGRGKTNKLKEIAKDESYYYYTYNKFIETLYSNALPPLVEDYLLYIVYFKSMHNFYASFLDFLLDAKDVLEFINNTPIRFADVHSSNKMFEEFKQTYIDLIKNLAKEKIHTRMFALENGLLKMKESIAVDDVDFLNFKELRALNRLKNFAVSYTNRHVEKLLSFDKIIEVNNEVKKALIVKKDSISIDEISTHINNLNGGILAFKNGVYKLYPYISESRDRDFDELIKYAANLKFFGKKDNAKGVVKTIEKINNLTGLEEDLIFKFVERYEAFISHHNRVFFSLSDVASKRFKTLFVDEHIFHPSQLLTYDNRLFPYDFFKEDVLISLNTTDIKNFLLSKAEKIVIFKNIEFNVLPAIAQPITLNSRDIKKISYSQLALYDVCPYRYKLRYINGLKEDFVPSLSYGSLIHELLEKYILFKVDVQDVIKEFKEKMLILAPKLKDMFYYYYEKGVRTITDFIGKDKEMFGEYETIAVEKEFEVPISNDVVFIGKIDRIVKSNDGKIKIIDYKTSHPKNMQQTIQHAQKQLSLYAWLLSNNGMKVDGAYVWLLNTNDVVEVEINKEDYEQEYKSILNMLENIKQGRFDPKPSRFACNTCSFRTICRYWKYV